MNIRVNIAAIFLVFVQVICVQLVSAEQSSNSTALTAAIPQDAIQQFVQGDFAQRRALLKQWPGSIEQLDQLAEYVENEQLYSGANGQTYILESDEKLLSYPSLGIVADWPSDLSQVTLVNTLRKALNFGLAQRKLKSEDASERLEAIDIYESNLAELNVAHINALYLNEQNNKVKARLAQLKARLDYQDADVLVKIQAAKGLQDSNRPDVLAMIDNELTQPNIHSELKASSLEARSSIRTRIQASECTGDLF